MDGGCPWGVLCSALQPAPKPQPMPRATTATSGAADCSKANAIKCSSAAALQSMSSSSAAGPLTYSQSRCEPPPIPPSGLPVPSDPKSAWRLHCWAAGRWRLLLHVYPGPRSKRCYARYVLGGVCRGLEGTVHLCGQALLGP